MSHIVPYLKYLREMSRKILMNKGFENVLYRKPTSQTPHYSKYPHDENLNNYWVTINSRIQESQQSSKTMSAFLGIGLFVGMVNQKSKKRKIAGPLLYAPIEVEQENSRSIQHFILWDEITFNYDLLSILMESDFDEEKEEETNPNNPSSFFDPIEANYRVISNLEEKIDSILTDPNFNDDFIKPEFCTSTYKLLREKFTMLKGSELGVEFTMEQRRFDELMKSNKLTFFNHSFTFLAQLPDDLTSFEELKKLLTEAQSK